MKRRPWILVVLAIFHVLSPFGNLILASIQMGLPLPEYVSSILKPEYFILICIRFVAPLIAGFAIYACKKWSFLVYLLVMSVLLASEFFAYQSPAQFFIISRFTIVFAFNILLVTYFLLPAVRKVYFNPRLRWWESDDRFKFDADVNFTSEGGSTHAGVIRNISNSGLFIKSNSSPEDFAIIIMKFLFQNEEYQFKGTVIRHQTQNDIGFGVRFLHDKNELQAIKKVTSQLQKDGLLIDDRKPKKEDSFLMWLKTLLKTGRGLLPK